MADPRILVLGVGNTLMCDDGVGVHAVRALVDGYELPANVRVIDGGVAGLRLLGDIAEADYLIIVDAVKRGGITGSIYRLRKEDLHPRRGPFVSAHEVGHRRASCGRGIFRTPTRNPHHRDRAA